MLGSMVLCPDDESSGLRLPPLVLAKSHVSLPVNATPCAAHARYRAAFMHSVACTRLLSSPFVSTSSLHA